LFAVRPDGSGLRQVNAEPFGDERDFESLAFSPVGTTISATRWVLESDLSRTPRVVLIDSDSGREQQLPIPSGTMSRNGVFSPDGTQVAYVRLQRLGPNQNAYEVAIAPVGGSGPGRTLGPTPSLPPNGSDLAPLSVAWSPDGTAVIARFGDDDDATYRWLPVDGSAGSVIAQGAFEFLDVQRVAR
jgi:DNA-binding beta-propeller fold protein YncE